MKGLIKRLSAFFFGIDIHCRRQCNAVIYGGGCGHTAE